ncbi:DNA mismatch repair protein MutS [Ruminococcaceae bacterium OttesenSCG-928-A16]|nr:DNA mismatch repair protein MutS [Ruminococcaceae bacterium OttesenSCG-928-A16]
MAELSPMMRQFFDIKNRNKDKILFFRVGDFYEMFFDDAILASKELELTLTGKECGQEERAPMCGVPHHSAEGYIARLIAKGYKVAICEQVEDPATAKGLVERDVVRVVTPGTVIETSMLQDDRNNYIASIYIVGSTAGICFADVSTGTAHTTYAEGANLAQQIIAELARFSPREVLFNSEILKHKQVTDYIKTQMDCSVELLDDEEFSESYAMQQLAAQFGSMLDDAVGLPHSAPGFLALGALIGYLGRTQKKGVERLKTVTGYKESQYMHLSPITRANLEITETMRGREKKGTLLWVLDKTGTAMGKRLLRLWLEQPLTDANAINSRLDGVEELFNENVARIEICETLAHVFDIERLMTRTVYGSATPREVAALAATCTELPVLKTQLAPFTSGELQTLRDGIDPLTDVQSLIEQTLADEVPAALKDGGVIRPGFNPEVDELRDIVHGGKGVLASIETRLKEETGIRTLKIGYNKVFGYYIEVSKTFVNQVPEGFIRKQTLTSGERYITEELKQLENKILGANERLAVLERDLFEQLLQTISEELLRIQRTAASVARLDVLASLAQVAVTNSYVRPQVNTGDELLITEGRHPVIEQMQKGVLFVPNDTKLDTSDNRMQIITGPNMAGKSTYMRQTALIALMAQVGSFVPAAQCTLGVCDAIFTRVGASDDLSQGQSTFMVEMTEVAEILEYATPKSLVILDEIGRGTSTFDGMSIAQAVVEYMASKDTGLGCKTMFATHYHELTELENSLDGVKNYNIAVKKRGDDITFLRRIVRGPADDSYGIQVAKLAGLPDEVTNRAKQVLKQLEATTGKRSKVTQLDFETLDDLNTVNAPAEMLEKLRKVDPETLTPIEALKFVYELKRDLPEA